MKIEANPRNISCTPLMELRFTANIPTACEAGGPPSRAFSAPQGAEPERSFPRL